MRRQWVLASLAGSVVLAGAAFIALPSRSPAEPNKAASASGAQWSQVAGGGAGMLWGSSRRRE